MKGVLLAIAVVLFVSGSAIGQTSNATVGGVVEDASQSVIPVATVTAKNLDTGVVATVLTTASGAYRFAGLRPGFYEVRAQSPRMQPRAYEYVYLSGAHEIRLNFTLDVGPDEPTIEMFLPMNFLQPAASGSVGSVLMASSLDALPTGAGNALDLVMAVPGTIGSNFAGGRVNQVNTTRDGISVNDGRYDNGVYSQTYVSTDLIEEVRVVISPADAEFGRGSGQVRMTTRSGTNQYHGTLFWADRNSALDANSWFNNFRHINKDYLNRNQFGGRLSGPLVKNKTFFFVLYEGMRTVQKEATFADVLTAEARQGIFRYFPGAQPGNARSANPTVDLLGNPVRPATATGPLASFNLFGRPVNGVFTPYDPFRTGLDSTGLMGKIIGSLPLPNDFTQHDGLNVAHYQWVRRRSGIDDVFGTGTDVNRDELNLRIDHHFNSSHRLSFTGSREHRWADNNVSNLPGGFNGSVVRHPQVYTASLVSTLKGTLVNEFRFGLRRAKSEDLQAYDVPGKTGEEARKYLGQSNGIPYIVIAGTLIRNYQFNDSGGSRANVVPLYTYADSLGWNRGSHALKGGVELRFSSNNAWNSDRIIPRVILGAGVPVTGIDATNIPGLIGMNQVNARTLLNDFAGSVAFIDEAFTLAPNPKNISFQDYRQLDRKVRDLHQNEWSAFFKDDWRLRPNLTLNLGLRYEYFGVPYEAHGLTAAPVGGGGVISDGSLLITPELVGKNSPQASKQLYKNDWNNFAPAVGLSWAIPYLGRDKTVLRAGYGISYQGGGRGWILDTTIGSFPGVNQFVNQRPSTYMDLSKVVLPIPGKAADGKLPVVPLTARNDVIYTWDPNMVTPYVQNSRLEIQRTISPDLTMSVRYVGSKGTKLFGFIEQNNLNIQNNGLLDAINMTRAGGNAQLFDQMLKGLSLGSGVVDGVNLTGSAALRQSSNSSGPLANGNVANFVYYLNSTADGTGVSGGLLRNGGLPENFIVRNPQFLDAYLQTNPGSSTYHSLQVAATTGPTHGFSSETTYTWSRAIGEADDDLIKLYLDPLNRSRDKSLLSFHRTHDLRSNGMFELPMGRGHLLFSNASPFLSRIVERWQLGAIFSLSSGAPFSIIAGNSPFSPSGSLFGPAPNVADLVGSFPKDFGKVTLDPNIGPIYFAGTRQVNDPARTNITPLQNLASAANLMALTDAQGNILIQNPKAGTIGNMGRQWLEGPGRIGLDVGLQKQITLAENRSLELRVDALNVLNHPQFANPMPNLNNPIFGVINAASGNRMFTLSARVSF